MGTLLNGDTNVTILAIKEIWFPWVKIRDDNILSHDVALTKSKPTIYSNLVYILNLTKYQNIIRFKTYVKLSI